MIEIEPVTCIGYGTDEWWELGRRRIEEVALWFWQYDGWWEEFDRREIESSKCPKKS